VKLRIRELGFCLHFVCLHFAGIEWHFLKNVLQLVICHCTGRGLCWKCVVSAFDLNFLCALCVYYKNKAYM
jgi:hypothetical protein